MNFNLQPVLQNELVIATPLKAQDFEELYPVACDPLIWEQHPNKDRYKKEVFRNFFKGAMESGGALLVRDAQTNAIIGSSRFYDLKQDSVMIGYTFFARSHWGGNYNGALKQLMIGHAFKYVAKVIFHIGAVNLRSQIAIQKLGAVKVDEQLVEYYGEPAKLNFVYEINRTV